MRWGVGNKAEHRNDQVGSLGGLAVWVSARMSCRGKDRKSKLCQSCVQGHGGTCVCLRGFGGTVRSMHQWSKAFNHTFGTSGGSLHPISAGMLTGRLCAMHKIASNKAKKHTQKRKTPAQKRETQRECSYQSCMSKKTNGRRRTAVKRHQQQRSKHACTTNTTTK